VSYFNSTIVDNIDYNVINVILSIEELHLPLLAKLHNLRSYKYIFIVYQERQTFYEARAKILQSMF